MIWWHVVLFALGVVAALVLVLWLFQRSLDKPGGRDGLGGMGGGSLGVMEQIFNPGQARAKEDLDAQKAARMVVPRAGDDDERRHGHVDFNADGTARSIHLRRRTDDS